MFSASRISFSIPIVELTKQIYPRPFTTIETTLNNNICRLINEGTESKKIRNGGDTTRPRDISQEGQRDTHIHTRVLVKMHACRGHGTRVYVHVGLAICNAL